MWNEGICCAVSADAAAVIAIIIGISCKQGTGLVANDQIKSICADSTTTEADV